MIYRPKKLVDLVGCEDIKKSISVSVEAAVKRNEPFPHTLIYAGPGLGKTTLANIIANEMGSPFKSYLSNVFKGREDVQNLLSSLNVEGYGDDGKVVAPIKPEIIFLDEIHQLNTRTQESLFEAMEDYKFTVQFRNPHNGTMEKAVYWVPKFTVIGATTKAGKLDEAFVERFKLRYTLRLYEISEICDILNRYCFANKIPASPQSITLIAERSRGIARKAVNFMERCRDMMVAKNESSVNKDIIEETFKTLHIDSVGLEDLDRQVLTYLYEIYPQKIGISRLSSVINVTDQVLKEIVEPYLLRQDFIDATPSGRLITEKGMIFCEKNNLIKKEPVLAGATLRKIPNV